MNSHLDILTFHRITSPGEKYFIPPMAMEVGTFSALIKRLSRANRLVGLEEGVKLLKEGKFSGRKVAISFDDGYRDNFTLAREILLKFDAPATFFVPVAPMDSQKPYWWDHLRDVLSRKTGDFLAWALSKPNPTSLQRALETVNEANAGRLGERCRVLVQALNGLSETEREAFLHECAAEFGPCAAESLLMTWDDVRQLHRDGFAVGSHSVSHIPLPDLDNQAAGREIRDSADLIEERIGQRPEGFCYPRGAFSPEHARAAAEAGYAYAVTTRFGTNRPGSDPFSLNRRNMSDYQGIRARFPVAMHMLELTGRFDAILAARRTA